MPHGNTSAINHRIGFVSTRFNSTDGVSLETEKWATVLKELDNSCFYFAGLCDRPADISYVVPEAYFYHPEIELINKQSYSKDIRPKKLSLKIDQLKEYFKEKLYDFIHMYEIELLIIENALAIPLNIPLGMALTEVIAETGIPTIAHHHDFFWERKRFLVNCVYDYLSMSFPPNLPTIRHVVINSAAAGQLSRRNGVSARIIPNVMDFDNPPQPPDDYTLTLRDDLVISSDEYLFLQPTRVVRRKGIEHAIELISRMRLKAKLVISHASGDEGDSYEERVRSFADLLGVHTNFVSDIIREYRGTDNNGRKIYSLWDVYPFADLVTYPSILEGFGNAFLEAIYFSRPILVNNYTIYAIDIKPKGFKAIEFDGYITEQTVEEVCNLIETPSLVEEMTEHNYKLARRYYSYTVLERQLHALLQTCFGEGS